MKRIIHHQDKRNKICCGIFLAAIFSIFIFAQDSFAANHYIRAGAAGTNNGSDWTNAWASFSAATWTRGDTYYVAGGMYPENVSISRAVSGTLWIYVKKATPVGHGTDIGWNDSYGTGQAEINGTLTVLYSYVDIDGVTGSDDSGYGIKVHYTGCDSVFNGTSIVWLGQGADSIYLRHIEIAGCGFGTYDSTDGLYHQNLDSNPGTDIQISYCWIHDVSRNGVTIGNHRGTSFASGKIGFLFENNRLERTGGCLYPNWHGQGVQVYGGTQDYMLFRNNKFIDISGTGYIAYLGGTVNDHIRIYNNIFYATDRNQFTASPGVITFLDSGISVNNVLIYNNTFYNLDLKGVTNWVSSGSGNELKNNIFVNSRFTYGQLGFTSQYNDYYGNISSGGSGEPSGEVGQQSESSDPFVNSAGYDFHLKATSNARGHGVDLSSLFTADRDGAPRPQGSAWDIGAYAYSDWKYDWSKRTDRHNMPAGTFDITPFPITENTTEYVIKNDEFPSGRNFNLGTKYYVDGGFSGAGNGSWLNPYKTIKDALLNVGAGNNTIIIRGAHGSFNGIYAETINLKAGLDDTHRFMITGYGQERPVINYESPILTGSYGPYAQSYTVTAPGAVSYATLQRVRIQDNYGGGVRLNNDDSYIHIIDVWLYNNDKYHDTYLKPLADGNLYFLGSDNNWLFHTTTEHVYGHGFKIGDDARGNIIEWCKAKDVGYWQGFPLTSYYSSSATAIDVPNDSGDSDGDGVPDRGWNTIIRYNIVDTSLYYGVQIRRCPNFSFHHNEVFNACKFDAVDMSVKGVSRKQVAICLEDTYGQVYDNIIRDPGSLDTAAIEVSGCNNADHKDINIYNNLIYGGQRSIGPLGYGGVDSTGISISTSTNVSINIMNNSLYADNLASLILSSNSQPANTTLNLKNNIFFQAGSGRSFSFNGFSDWSVHDYNLYYAPRGSFGVTLNANELNSDPLWRLIPSGDYRPAMAMLSLGSPARNKGLDLGTPFDTDFSGISRWQGSPWDMGIAEYADSIILYGDVSGDGQVTAYDAALTAQASVGLITLTTAQITAVDVDGSGDITAYDAALIAQRAVDLITKFPVEGG